MTSQEEQKKNILMETNQHAVTMYHDYLAGGRGTGVLRKKQQHMIKQHYCIRPSLVTKKTY